MGLWYVNEACGKINNNLNGNDKWDDDALSPFAIFSA